jgi:hypothetical protein
MLTVIKTTSRKVHAFHARHAHKYPEIIGHICEGLAVLCHDSPLAMGFGLCAVIVLIIGVIVIEA